MSTEPSDRSSRWPTLLRWTDQVACCALIVGALIAIGASWIHHGGLRGRLIDIEHATNGSVQFQLDVNHAEWPEWTVLPGIGEVLAQRIVASRQAVGPFQSHDDLLRVDGIGPKKLAEIRPYLLPVEPGLSDDGTSGS